MPAGPFLGASMGKMFDKTTEGVVQGQMQRMLLDRQDRRDALNERRVTQEGELKQKELELRSQQYRQQEFTGAVNGFANFLKTTRNPEAAQNFWNQNFGNKFGTMEVKPTLEGNYHIVGDTPAGEVQFLYNPDTGEGKPLMINGKPYVKPITPEQDYKNLAAETKIGEMSSGDPDRALPAAGIATGGRGKQMTPDAAEKEKIHALESLKKLKAGDGDNFYAQIVAKNLGIDYRGAKQDPEVDRRLEDAINKHIETLDAIIGGGSTTSAGGNASSSPSSKMAPGWYRSKKTNKAAYWDGFRWVNQ